MRSNQEFPIPPKIRPKSHQRVPKGESHPLLNCPPLLCVRNHPPLKPKLCAKPRKMTQQVIDEQTNKETNNGAPKHEIHGQVMSELTIKDWMVHE